jgi:hypothetical protein
MSALLATRETTAGIIAGMLTENTGRSFLDSGGESGRAWQRNAGMTVADFEARPAGTYDAEYETLTVDTFHYLNELLTFDAERTAEWVTFDAERSHLSWGETLDEWLDTLGVPAEGGGDFYSNARWGFNSYNFDGCLLSSTIQGVKFVSAGTEYLALQIHGGADVRGGYTAFKIFTGDIESVILGTTRATLRCPECDFYAGYSDGMLEDYYLGDALADPNMLIEMDVPTELPAGWAISDGCPLHKVALV